MSTPNKYHADGSRRDEPTAKPIKEAWDYYSVEVLGPLIDRPTRDAMKIAFFAGANATWTGLKSAAQRDQQEEVENNDESGWANTAAFHEAIEAEIDAFLASGQRVK